MPVLPNMSLITPTLGGDSGTWDDKINACFGLIDAHDHTSGKGVQVPVSGLNINADFAMAGQAVTGLGSIAFNAVTALVAGSKRLFVSSADNELYWRTNSGTNVKLTSGTSINTTLVGGIVGDYSSVGALLAYDDANKRYTLKTQTSTWARLATGPVRIYEYNTSESVYVEHAVAAALASSYTVTWPAALPGAAALVQISSAGVVSFSNSLAGAITADDYKISSGSSRRKVIPLGHGQQTGGGGHIFNTNSWALTTTSLATISFPVELDVGCRILTVALVVNKASNASNTITVDCVKANGTGSGSSILDGAAALTNAANAPGTVTLSQTLGTPYTFITRECVHITVVHSANPASATDTVYAVEITYDRP